MGGGRAHLRGLRSRALLSHHGDAKAKGATWSLVLQDGERRRSHIAEEKTTREAGASTTPPAVGKEQQGSERG
eukprot:CAMPEP_0194737156 /NCGR_PEP_ID=MMETSP0296-20130528/80104_1 /TAXON_ID=39354 /ORGANISM="Heterosigma akashiwo, Strain CCMP2393" /LENGTH=72 /DNA_ID=CAMNT_0039647007 /DNA_START=101 /DNA_END=316 /DNA_ORIENTATION=-